MLLSLPEALQTLCTSPQPEEPVAVLDLLEAVRRAADKEPGQLEGELQGAECVTICARHSNPKVRARAADEAAEDYGSDDDFESPEDEE